MAVIVTLEPDGAWFDRLNGLRLRRWLAGGFSIDGFVLLSREERLNSDLGLGERSPVEGGESGVLLFVKGSGRELK